MEALYSINPRKEFLQYLFSNFEDIRYRITACLFDHEIFAFVIAFGIKWAPRDVKKCKLFTRSLFSNVDIVHKMVSEGYTVAILGKAILQYQEWRLGMDAFVRQCRFNTGLKLYIAFVKLEKVRRQKFGTDHFVDGYNSAFPPTTPEMLTAVESDNPMITLHLLNTSENERPISPEVPNDLIGDIVHSKFDCLATPYIILSQRPEDTAEPLDFGFNSNIALIEPMTHRRTPANDRPVVHMLFHFQGLSDDSLERGKLSRYAGWDMSNLVGIAPLYTCEAVQEFAEGASNNDREVGRDN